MSKNLLLKELSRYNIGSFADIIYRNALLYPDNEAFVYGDTRISFSQYNSRVNRLISALLKMGIKKGETVGILSWNCPQFADFNGAVMKGGFIGSPFNTRLTADELEYIINYSETRVLFFGPEFIELLDSLRKRLPKIKHYILLEGSSPGITSLEELLNSSSDKEPDIEVGDTDPMYLIYTSGTTGVPRGALYDQQRIMDDTKTLTIDNGFLPGDKHLQITPLFHIAGSTWFRAFMFQGLCNVILKTFNPTTVLEAIQKEKVTHVNVVPTQLVAIYSLPDFNKYDLTSMKQWWSGGSVIPMEVMKKALSILGPTVAEGFGQSESGPAICHLPRVDLFSALSKGEEEQKILIAAGKPDIGVHVRIIDEHGNDLEPAQIGEIIVKSKHIMKEYWHKPDDTKTTIVKGWLYTGDMGYYDEKGYIYLSDRKKDMIISGGENVYPREVEEILFKHTAIQDAAVIGIPDDYWVEKVHAVVVLKENTSASPEEIMTFCKKYIAGYKCPKSVEFIDALPKNPTGKVLKKELRAKYWQGRQRKI